MTAGDAARGRDAVRGDRPRGAAAGAGLRGGGDARAAAVARSAARRPGGAGRRRALPVVPARRGAATMGLIAVELVVASLVLYATLNERLYGGFTPWSALPSGVSPTGADDARRAPRARCRGCVTLWLDPAPACCAGRRSSPSCPSPPGCCWRSRAGRTRPPGAGARDRRGGGRAGAGRLRRRAAGRDVPRADDRHRAVRRPLPDPGPARGRRADRLGRCATRRASARCSARSRSRSAPGAQLSSS